MTIEDLTGTDVAAFRKRLGSRSRLAALCGLSEGVIWRIENKNVFKNGERESIWYAMQNCPDSADTVIPIVQASPAAPEWLAEQVAQAKRLRLEGCSEEPEFTGLPCGHTTRDHGEEDLCPRHPRNKNVRLISHSELRTFKECRRKWWLGWFRGLRPKITSPIGALAIGHRVHRALREWYVPEGDKPIDPRAALELLIVQDWTTITQRYETLGLELSLETSRKFAQEADLERVMLEGYMQWLEETGADSDIQVIASETYIEVDVSAIVGSSYMIKRIAKLDVRVKRLSDGAQQFIDHKTVAGFDTPTRMLPLDEQMMDYTLLLKLFAGDDVVDGALYNMLKKTKRTDKSTPPFFDRRTVHHNRTTLKSYETRMIATIDDLERSARAIRDGDDQKVINQYAYPNPTWNCPRCPFFTVCSMFDDGSRVEEMIAEYFERGDVLSYYMEDTKLKIASDESE